MKTTDSKELINDFYKAKVKIVHQLNRMYEHLMDVPVDIKKTCILTREYVCFLKVYLKEFAQDKDGNLVMKGFLSDNDGKKTDKKFVISIGIYDDIEITNSIFTKYTISQK